MKNKQKTTWVFVFQKYGKIWIFAYCASAEIYLLQYIAHGTVAEVIIYPALILFSRRQKSLESLESEAEIIIPSAPRPKRWSDVMYVIFEIMSLFCWRRTSMSQGLDFINFALIFKILKCFGIYYCVFLYNNKKFK